MIKRINVNNKNLDNVKVKIDNYELVVFPFDLLFSLNVMSYSTVYDYMENYLFEENNIVYPNFKKMRILAGKKAKLKDKNPSLLSIYDNFDCNKLLKKKFIKLETKVVLDLINQVNPKIIELYNYCLEKNKTVAILNNTSLNDNNIKKSLCTTILNKCLLLSKINNVFTIYPNFNKCLVLNSLRNDYKCISKFKYRYVSNHYNLNKKERTTFSILCGFLNHCEYQNYYYNLGYRKVGILIYSFCMYLRKNIDSCNHNLYFLARDSYIIKKVFDILNRDNKYNTYYLYASRKSIKKSFYHYANNIEDLLDNIKIRKFDTYSSVFSKLGFNEKEINIIIGCKDNNFYNVVNVKDDKHFLKLLQDNFDQIKLRSLKNEENLRAYFNKINFKNNPILIDIGWRGTMQYYLNKIMPDIPIFGYYINRDNSIYTELSGNSYIPKIDNLFSYVGAFEILFAAPHGTTTGYNNETYVLDKCEYDSDDLQHIEQIDNGILDFTNDFDVVNSKLKLELTPNVSFSLLRNLLESPSYEDANNIGNINYLDLSVSKVCVNQNIFQYILNPKLFISSYAKSSWKVGFLKKFFVSSKISYLVYKFLNILNK